MAINTTMYTNNKEITLVEVFVNGKSVGICEESAVKDMLQVLGYLK